MDNLRWIKIDIAIPSDDTVQMIKIEGKKLCLVKHQNKIYVIQNTCPHAGGILSGGKCKDGHIICPIHRYEYNLETGKGREGQGDYIDTYPIETREDGIYINLKVGFWNKLFS